MPRGVRGVGGWHCGKGIVDEALGDVMVWEREMEGRYWCWCEVRAEADDDRGNDNEAQAPLGMTIPYLE